MFRKRNVYYLLTKKGTVLHYYHRSEISESLRSVSKLLSDANLDFKKSSLKQLLSQVGVRKMEM